ncbi:MAG: Pls/PosA family non-ribosomal peptide synthetase [Geminicoccaceae bacterium]
MEISEIAMTPGPANSSAAGSGLAAPATTNEQRFAEVLAKIVGVEQVSLDAHFFDDLGADSMAMARFCARIRKLEDLPSVSMKQVYQNPTIRDLSTALADDAPAAVKAPPPVPIEVVKPASTLEHIICGTLQFLFIVGYPSLIIIGIVQSFTWISAGTGAVDYYLRVVLIVAALFLVLCLLPILAKWILIGRWKPQQIRIWSLEYFRFWVVKFLVGLNPLVSFAGSPIYVLYLRALGAKIGRDVVLLSQHVPVCSDLLTIGDNAIVRKDCLFSCYRAHAGLIQTGTVSLGRDALVGEMTVLDIDTKLGDGAQLGHASSLYTGQSIPDGEHRYGSPARQRTEMDYRAVDPTRCSTLRKVVYSVVQLLNLLLLTPLIIVSMAMLIIALHERLPPIWFSDTALADWTFYANVLITSIALFCSMLLVGLILVVTIPRLLNLAIEPNKIYPLYGVHYAIQGFIARATNVKFFLRLFGDSSYIVHYLRAIGYDLSEVVQTGSNFGTTVKHDNPFLVSIGSGTMVADGLSIVNAEYSSTSFRMSQVSIGPNSFLGNTITYPPGGKTGNNCLLATKVLVPLDGEVREDVGLLGAPSFEIPRTVLRDSRFDHVQSGVELSRQLATKNWHNLISMGLLLLARWFEFFVLIILLFSAVNLYFAIGTPAFVLLTAVSLVFRFFYHVLVERMSTLFQDLKSLHCSIYHPYFWFVERYWKLSVDEAYLKILDGTPFKSLAWRLLGVRIGKRVFDDGCGITEKTLTAIGDDCTLNPRCCIQSHSQEDGSFKSDPIAIGAGCTLGVGSHVHYGVSMGDGAQLAPDAFLMKGEEVPKGTRWGDNPAREVRNDDVAHAASTMTAPLWPTAKNNVTAMSGGQVR